MGQRVRLAAATSLLIAAALGTTPSPAGAAPDTLTVNTTADVGSSENPNACTGEEPGGSECPLRAALEFVSNINSDAATEEVVVVPPGDYKLTKGTLVMGQAHAACEGSVKCPFTLRGAGAGATVIGHVGTRLLTNVSGAGPVTIERVTLAGGSTLNNGAAIGAEGLESLTVRESVLTENLSNASGGAISTSAPLTIEDSSITANRAKKGGAVEIRHAPLTLLRSTVSGNEALEGGGGGLSLIEEFGDPVIATLTDSTVAGNSASEDGGGIYAVGKDKLALRYSTIAGNTAAKGGGGLGGTGFASMVLEGAIVASDSPTECAGIAAVSTVAANILSGSSSCPVVLGPAPVVADPKLGPLSANGGFGATMPLLRGSPAINAGGSSCPTTEALDQRHVTRPRGAACDLGAFETASDVGVTLAATPNPVSVGGSLALTATIVNSGAEALSGVTLIVPVPAGTSFGSAPAGCTAAFSGTTTVTCRVGSLASGQSVAVSIMVRPESAGALSETASVSADQADYDPSNDTATIASIAAAPAILPGPKGVPGATGTGASGLTLVGRTFTFDRHGAVTVRVKCSASANGACHAAIAIYSSSGALPAGVARAGRKATLLAIAHATIKPGKTISVRLPLDVSGRKLARAHRSFHARMVLSAHGASARILSHAYAVTLKRAAAKRRR